MKKIIVNEYNLSDSDIDDVVKRVKVLIINSDNELLLGYSHNEYQFPGGHMEDGESLVETAVREVLEETGIELNLTDMSPFASFIRYYKDTPIIGKNKKSEIYYFKVMTDETPNLLNTKYTEDEKDGNFELKYISISEVEDVLKKNREEYGYRKGITDEMLGLLNIYKLL